MALALLCGALLLTGCAAVQPAEAAEAADVPVAPERVRGALLVAGLVALAVFLGFMGLWRAATALDPMEERMQDYGRGVAPPLDEEEAVEARGRGGLGDRLTRLLMGMGLGQGLADALSRADLPFTATEFALLVLGAGVLGFIVGLLRVGLGLALVLGVVGGALPLFYLRMAQGRRQRAFTAQLPDMLTLLVGGLRAGHGMSQALSTLADQMPPPTSTEVERVLRAVRLGLPMDRALYDMAERVGTEDVRLMVTAIVIQRESGGNLAETLEIIGDTLRDRVRLHREVETLTAQQRLSGVILALLPVALALGIFLINPEFFQPFFEPGWPRLLPAAAVVMTLVGFFFIRRILDIEV